MRSLDVDAGGRGIGWIAFAVVLLALWLAWFLLAQVRVYEVSESARLEVNQQIHPVTAAIAGRVVAERLTLGASVAEGDVLVELDSDAERLALVEERARIAALAPPLAALRDEVTAEQASWKADVLAAKVRTEEAHAQLLQAEALARFAEEEHARMARLGGTVSELELMHLRAEADQRGAAADALRVAPERIAAERDALERKHEATLADLRRSIAVLEGQATEGAAREDCLAREVERRLVRAPIAGRLGEVATLKIGGFLHEGDRVAAIVPPGELRVVADFAPGTALGRVRPGAPARVRLDGFPWTQYGSLEAVVDRVAEEPRDGHLRVELAVPQQKSRIPLQHGLSGVAEVEVERASPAVLVLRANGEFFSGRRVHEAR
jgi:membrane fusion protein (multidrug efflux system)